MYDASFAKLLSLVAYRDCKRSEDQRILQQSLVGSIRFLNFVSASLGIVWERLGTVWGLPPPSNKSAPRLKKHEWPNDRVLDVSKRK